MRYEWSDFFFPPKLFSVRDSLATLLKSTTTLHHLSHPQYSPDLLPPHSFSPWDLLSSHMLSFLLIYVYCLLSSQKHKLHKCRNLSLFINQCKHLKLLRIVSVFSTLKMCFEGSHLISLLRTTVKFISSMAAECWDCFCMNLDSNDLLFSLKNTHTHPTTHHHHHHHTGTILWRGRQQDTRIRDPGVQQSTYLWNKYLHLLYTLKNTEQSAGYILDYYGLFVSESYLWVTSFSRIHSNFVTYMYKYVVWFWSKYNFKKSITVMLVY